jgi:hypothetical protein
MPLEEAALRGLVSVFIHRGVDTDIPYFEIAALNGHNELLDHLANEDTVVVYDNFFTQNWAKLTPEVQSWYLTFKAATNGDLEKIKELISNNIWPTQKAINIAAQKGHLELLKYLSQYNLLPDTEGANRALYGNRPEVLRWLEQQGILPTRLDVDVNNYDFNTLQWATDHGATVPQYTITNTIDQDDYILLVWLLAHSGVLTSEIVDDVAFCSVNRLEYLEKLGVLPTSLGAHRAQDDCLETLEWMAARGIYPS